MTTESETKTGDEGVKVEISQTELDELKGKASKVDELDGRVNDLQETLGGSGYLDFLDGKDKPKEKEKLKETETTTTVTSAAPTKDALNEMDNASLATHMATAVGGQITAAIKEITKRLDAADVRTEKDTKATNERISVSNMRERVTTVATEKDKDGSLVNPGFWDYKKEMYELSIKMPNLDPQDAYDLVVGRKSKTEFNKLKKEEQGRVDERARRASSEKPAESVPVKSAEGTAKTFTTAFEAAWNQHVGAGRDRIGK